ncbi:hypothetical protein SAMN04488071_0811 [Kordiimonas lacus]|uniref:Uncharacterized protein n=2 Tax=Kordiimonas lacus TaxID=637679 RepID=A0A1G6VRS3_9PROT|nr:hypothetical protein SAMN04488071_0811 [Kordiimonas lacus]
MVVMVGIMIASEIANGVWPSLLLFVSGLALFSLPVLLANNFIDRVKPQEDPKKINPVIDICFAACIVGAIGVYHYQATPSCFSEGLITEDMTIREVEELCSENKN